MLKEFIINKLGGVTIADAIDFANRVATVQSEKSFKEGKKIGYNEALSINRDPQDADWFRGR